MIDSVKTINHKLAVTISDKDGKNKIIHHDKYNTVIIF